MVGRSIVGHQIVLLPFISRNGIADEEGRRHEEPASNSHLNWMLYHFRLLRQAPPFTSTLLPLTFSKKSGRSLPRKLKHDATLPAQRVLLNI